MNIQELIAKFRKPPTDLVGIDVGSTATKVVRIRAAGGEMTLTGLALFPPSELKQDAADAPAKFSPLVLPPPLKAKYAGLAVTGDDAVIKVLSFPGAFGPESEGKLMDGLGVDNPAAYVASYKVLTQGHGKSESKVLVVGLPESRAHVAPQLLPIGLPAPYSMEIAGLATFTTLLHGPGREHADGAFAAIDFGARTTTFAVFNKRILSLIRRFSFGTENVVESIQESLGVDQETAQGILTDGAFDVSQSVNEVMEPLMKQVGISRDFVERRENCRISRVYVSGGLTFSNDCRNEIHSTLALDAVPWNVLDALKVPDGTVPDDLAPQTWRFGAAIGACLGTLEPQDVAG